MDNNKIEKAVHMFLEGVGEDPNREGLRETPKRVAKMSHELFRGLHESVDGYFGKSFEVDGTNFVEIHNIEFHSLCEHHLLPFYGQVHIGYIPEGRVLGLSKFYRIVDLLASKATLQEQLTNQIAEDIYINLKCKSVIVVINAKHMCVQMRGVKKLNSYVQTQKVIGNMGMSIIEGFIQKTHI